jgi:hypothetical protein
MVGGVVGDKGDHGGEEDGQGDHGSGRVVSGLRSKAHDEEKSFRKSVKFDAIVGIPL